MASAKSGKFLYWGRNGLKTIAAEMGVEARYQVLQKLLVKILGLFMPIMKELVEMIYQYDRDYVFDSSKFEERFEFTPTPYLEGIKNIVNSEFKDKA